MLLTDGVFLLLAGLLLAGANGSNDNFKGVATLYGSGTLGYRSALTLATVATFAGSALALILGAGLVESFSGKGLVPEAVVATPGFLSSTGLAAAVTVTLASWMGLPVSTTHALVGALLGAGLAEAGDRLSFARLGSAFVAPLLASPLVASILGGVVYLTLSRSGRGLGIRRDACLCVGDELLAGPALGAAAALTVTTATVSSEAECRRRYQSVVSVTSGRVFDGLHCLSASAVSFARGVNDTPKIVALLAASRLLAPEHGLVIVGASIAVGGVVGARKVAETMSHRITSLDPAEGLVANLITALLVLFASRFGLPVSTTHVSCGALFGIGAVTRKARWKTVRQILLAWLTTLPMAAAFGAIFALVGPR